MILADESLNGNLIHLLRENGFAVSSIAEDCAGVSDRYVAEMSLRPPHIIVSEDKDFGELVYHHKVSVIGVILLRYNPAELELIKLRLVTFLNEYQNSLQGKFVVININKTRIRRL